MSERSIIHLDLDAFFCAVEELDNPALGGKPFAVGGRPEHRGVVASCSYPARRLGIRSAMPMVRALQLCPELIVLPGRHKVYRQKSHQVMDVLNNIAPLVEQLSIDEAFLDVSTIPGDKLDLARSLQKKILDTTRLSSSLGIAANKLVAKIATDVGKASVHTAAYPHAIQYVPPGEEAAFLAPLPIETLWGVGPKTAESLQKIHILTIGDLAQWPAEDLAKRFGKNGYDLHQRANGLDKRPVETRRDPKSISQEITFSRDTADKTRLSQQIQKQSEQVAHSLEINHLLCTTVKIKLRWPDFTTITRQETLLEPTREQEVIFRVAYKLFNQNWDRTTPIRLIGVGASGLQQPSKQLSLFDKVDYTKLAQLEAALHHVRDKYGPEVIQRGPQKSDNPDTPR